MGKADSQKAPGHAYAYLVATVAAVGGFLFGYDLSVISSGIIFLKASKQWSTISGV